MNLKLIKGMRLVAATHNPGKAREIEALLDGHYTIVTAGELNLPEPDETETTFAGNAMLKARHAAERSGAVALADDSGLSVAALDGAPGIFSARWAGPGKDFALAMKKVEDRLDEVGASDRRAWFTSALAVAWPDGPCVVVEGVVEGETVRLSPQRPGLGSTHSDTLRAAALAGMGIVGLPSFVAADALRDGSLVRVLPGWYVATHTLYAAMPTRKYLPARTRALLDFLLLKLGGEAKDPWLAGECHKQQRLP